MSDLNPILSGSAQSIAAYQDAIEQSTKAVVQWLQQPEMYPRARVLSSCVSA